VIVGAVIGGQRDEWIRQVVPFAAILSPG
jgi:hypothetical protein